MRRVLAVTLDGILQPIGYSQVARVALGLAAAGVPYAIASLERARDLADADHVRRVHSTLADADVPWYCGTFEEGGGARAIATNLAVLGATSASLARRTDAGLVHARAFTGGLIARTLRATARIPYLFDARAYWVDEQREGGRRLNSSRAFAAAKAMERDMFGSAAAVVTLTDLQAGDVREGRLGQRASRRFVEVIPTCADYTAFRIAEPGAARPARLAAFAGDAPLLAIVGALNTSYHADATARFAAAMLEESPSLRLVVLSQQQDEHRELLTRAGVPAERTLITAVPHAEIPEWVPHFDWGLLLLRSPFAKRGSMPTKLAEFFASGVRPLQHGCNEEVSSWVARAGSGLVLPSLDDADLRAFARRASALPRDAGVIEAARERTRAHFSVESAVSRYRRALDAAAS